MPSIHFEICGVPIRIEARTPRLLALSTDHFRYYPPRLVATTPKRPPALLSAPARPVRVELKMKRSLPPLDRLIPPAAELLVQADGVRLWREAARAHSPERFYLHTGAAAFRANPEESHIAGLITPESLTLPQASANIYVLLALLLRARGFYHLHAAAVVSPRDELYLICGQPRAGKTTLTIALGLAGWRPISDDGLLMRSDGAAIKLRAFKRDFHPSNDLLARWPQLDRLTRRYQYLARTSVAGLEFFGTTELAEKEFKRVDRIILPQITGEASSSLSPVPASDAIFKLAEQSMYFQIWKHHTERQLNLLSQLASATPCDRLLAGADILADPRRAAEVLEQASEQRRLTARG